MPRDVKRESRRASNAVSSRGDLQPRIEQFFEQHDWDIVCRRRKRGYAVFCADCRAPLVKFRATGHGDEVKLFSWDEDQWQPVTDFDTALPLDDALEHVDEDPDGVFHAHYERKTEDAAPDDEGSRRPTAKQQRAAAAADMVRYLLLSSSAGGFVGGLCHGGWRGLAWGAAFGFLVPLLVTLLRSRMLGARTRRSVWYRLSFMAVAGPGGMIGGAVNQAVGGGIWGGVAGSGIGLVCGLLLVFGGWATWLVAFTAGLVLGELISAAVGLQGHFVGTAMTALLASALGYLYREVIDRCLLQCLPVLRQHMKHQKTA